MAFKEGIVLVIPNSIYTNLTKAAYRCLDPSLKQAIVIRLPVATTTANASGGVWGNIR